MVVIFKLIWNNTAWKSVKLLDITNYTESEFLELLNNIINAEGTDQYQDELLENFIATTGHPDGSDLIYYPAIFGISYSISEGEFR